MRLTANHPPLATAIIGSAHGRVAAFVGFCLPRPLLVHHAERILRHDGSSGQPEDDSGGCGAVGSMTASGQELPSHFPVQTARIHLSRTCDDHQWRSGHGEIIRPLHYRSQSALECVAQWVAGTRPAMTGQP
jgi:hypothetical protein